MSVERFWAWKCDACGKVEQRGEYGLPAGWIFVKGQVITHRCPDCKEGIPEGRRGIPGVVAKN